MRVSECSFPMDGETAKVLLFLSGKICFGLLGEPSSLRSFSSLSMARLVYNIDLVTVFDAILTSRQTCEKLQCLYENLMSNDFRKTAVQKKI